MNLELDKQTFSVPLALEAHRAAQRFQGYGHGSDQIKQNYLNILAIYAVKYYLESQGLVVDTDNNYSLDPLIHSFINTATVEVKGGGKLECRPVLPNEETLKIPEEVWEDRIGYVAVSLEPSLQEATLLGFIPQATRVCVPLSELHSLEDLPDYLDNLNTNQSTATSQVNTAKNRTVKPKVSLSSWLDNFIEAGWLTVEELFGRSSPQFAMAFRDFTTVRSSAESNLPTVQLGKYLDCGDTGKQVKLLVGIQRNEALEMDISVALYPSQGQTYLPTNLQLMILDDQGKSVMQAQAGDSESLEFTFSGKLNEEFSIQVAIEDCSVVENFVI